MKKGLALSKSKGFTPLPKNGITPSVCLEKI